MIYHVLKDGTITNDISGHIVKITEARNIYNLMTEINTTKREETIRECTEKQ